MKRWQGNSISVTELNQELKYEAQTFIIAFVCVITTFKIHSWAVVEQSYLPHGKQ